MFTDWDILNNKIEVEKLSFKDIENDILHILWEFDGLRIKDKIDEGDYRKKGRKLEDTIAKLIKVKCGFTLHGQKIKGHTDTHSIDLVYFDKDRKLPIICIEVKMVGSPAHSRGNSNYEERTISKDIDKRTKEVKYTPIDLKRKYSSEPYKSFNELIEKGTPRVYSIFICRLAKKDNIRNLINKFEGISEYNNGVSLKLYKEEKGKYVFCNVKSNKISDIDNIINKICMNMQSYITVQQTLTKEHIYYDDDIIYKMEELDNYIPKEIELQSLKQTDYPKIAKNKTLMNKIIKSVKNIPNKQTVVHGDSRYMNLKKNGIHLVVTSPPYWILKKYESMEGQLGDIQEYEDFLSELYKVWEPCFDSLVPGGRMVVVVGDVCLSRRSYGRHRVVPLHSSIQEQCRRIGFDNLSPIIWYKIANIKLEVEGSGRFLGKPYEPNAIVKNDIEYILFFRKPGGYRRPTKPMRILSLIPDEDHKIFFQQIWSDIPGASLRKHPAPYPLELAERLIRMFSFVGDTVLDPFVGTGTTLYAAGLWGRNGIGYEIDKKYVDLSLNRLKGDIRFTNVELIEKNI